MLRKLAYVTAVAAALALPADAMAHGGHGGGGHHGGGQHGGRWWSGYGVGPCWQWTPAGYVWVCN